MNWDSQGHSGWKQAPGVSHSQPSGGWSGPSQPQDYPAKGSWPAYHEYKPDSKGDPGKGLNANVDASKGYPVEQIVHWQAPAKGSSEWGKGPEPTKGAEWGKAPEPTKGAAEWGKGYESTKGAADW